jgi:hypothetical protein
MFSVRNRELLLLTPGLFEELDGFYKRLNAFLTEGHDDEGALLPPEWVSVPYDARNFHTDSGTWTVEAADQLLFKYLLVGKVMTVAFNFANTTLSGVGNELRVRIPGGKLARNQEWTGFVYAFGTTEAIAVCVTRLETSGGSENLSIQRIPVAAWPNSTNAQVLRGAITFETQ